MLSLHAVNRPLTGSFGSTMKAMIVDDSQATLLHLAQMVETTSGLTCQTFADPDAALTALQSDFYDIVLVDYVMPRMDGIELISRIRTMARYDLVPVIMISSTVTESVRLRALEAGASEFLPKAVNGAELKIRLRNLINLSIATHKLNDQAAWLVREVEAATKALHAREEEMIFRLSLAVEYRDNDTGGHTLRVAQYSRIIAEELGLPASACRSIFLASPLHDIGKVAIPDAVLLKPGRLDAAEFDVVKTHSAIGERILSGSSSDLIELAADIAGAHHERWDGGGYPRGLKGRLIPLPARIVAVADVFDALTTTRPYKTAMTPEEAAAYIVRERGHHLCPTCVDAFLSARSRILAIAAETDRPALFEPA